MSIELKSCPFCGGRASVYDWQTVVGIGCSDENCPGSMLSEWCFSTTYDAAETWNTRAERTCKVLSAVDRGSIFPFVYALSCGHVALEWTTAPSYCPSCGAKVVEE